MDRQRDLSLHRVVWEDLRETDLERTFRREFKALPRFYLAEHQLARLRRMGAFRAFFWRIGWLFKGMVLRLSPARRLMLVAAIVLSAFHTSFVWGKTEVSFGTRWIGFVLLLLVLMLELKDKLVARDEIGVARRVQLSLLPTRAPAVAGWTIWGHSRPANDVGGDMVDYLALEDERWGVALGDVAGKGMGAALLTAKLQATLRALQHESGALEALGARLNAILYRDGLDNRYATLFYCEVDPHSNRVRYLNAGHHAALLIHGERVRTLEASSYPLGMFPSTEYTEGSVDLQAGDLLVVYSDGLTEAADREGREFGEQRLKTAVRRAGAGSPESVGRRVLSELERFIGEERPADDLSLLILSRSAGP